MKKLEKNEPKKLEPSLFQQMINQMVVNPEDEEEEESEEDSEGEEESEEEEKPKPKAKASSRDKKHNLDKLD